MNGAGGSQMSLQPVAKYEDEKWLYANVINKIHLVFTPINIKQLYRSNRNSKKDNWRKPENRKISKRNIHVT